MSGWVGGATAYLAGALDGIKAISAQLGLGFGLSLANFFTFKGVCNDNSLAEGPSSYEDFIFSHSSKFLDVDVESLAWSFIRYQTIY